MTAGGEESGGEEGEGKGVDAEDWDRVYVGFSVSMASSLPEGEAVYVCGNVGGLGSWRPEAALPLLRQVSAGGAGEEWRGELALPKRHGI